MKCLICKQAETLSGFATVTLERNGLTMVVKKTPAQVCPNCGEQYVDEEVTKELLRSADQVEKSGAQVEIRQYVAAS